MLGVCVGVWPDPVGTVVGAGLAAGLEVVLLPPWLEVELEAEVLPPSAALQREFKERKKS